MIQIQFPKIESETYCSFLFDLFSLWIVSDFTLNHFANASAAVAKSGRMKKGETKPLNAADGMCNFSVCN